MRECLYRFLIVKALVGILKLHEGSFTSLSPRPWTWSPWSRALPLRWATSPPRRSTSSRAGWRWHSGRRRRAPASSAPPTAPRSSRPPTCRPAPSAARRGPRSWTCTSSRTGGLATAEQPSHVTVSVLYHVLFQDVCRVLHDQRTVPLHRPACVLQLQGKELERSRFQQQLHSARSGSPSTPANVRRNCPSFESGEWGGDADRGCPAPASTQETSDSEGNYSSSGRRLTLFWFKSR